jgi:hypothetical protein
MIQSNQPLFSSFILPPSSLKKKLRRVQQVDAAQLLPNLSPGGEMLGGSFRMYTRKLPCLYSEACAGGRLIPGRHAARFRESSHYK